MLKAYLKISKLNSKNQIIKKGRKKVSRSFLKAFITILARQFAVNTTYATNDINGTSVDHIRCYNPLWCNGGGGDGQWVFVALTNATSSDLSTVGIVVGTDTTAVQPTDDSLNAQIAHGTGVGQLEYFGNLISAVSVTAPNASFQIERIFRNMSGGNIAIGETGIYALHEYGTNDAAMYCIVRDALVATVTVLNTEYLKVKYTLQITV